MPHDRTHRAIDERLPDWGVRMIESHHADDFVMEWREHDFLKLIYVLRGSGKLETRRDAIDYRAGDCVWVPPGTANRVVDQPQTRPSLYICCIAKARFDFDDQLIRGRREKAAKIGRGGATERGIASLMRRMMFTQADPRPDRAIRIVADALALVRIAINSLDRETDTRRPHRSEKREAVTRYAADLQRRFFETTTIDQAADELGMSRRTFTDAFAEAIGMTWLQYRRKLAIEYATRRLRQTDLPVASIAFESGFADLSTFYRQFKLETGTAPTEFRRRSESKSETAET